MSAITVALKKECGARIAHRAKILRGHINALIRMIDDGAYCIEVLHQSLAIQKALKSLERLMLERHLRTCVKKQMRGQESGRAVQELLGIYHLTQ